MYTRVNNTQSHSSLRTCTLPTGACPGPISLRVVNPAAPRPRPGTYPGGGALSPYGATGARRLCDMNGVTLCGGVTSARVMSDDEDANESEYEVRARARERASEMCVCARACVRVCVLRLTRERCDFECEHRRAMWMTS